MYACVCVQYTCTENGFLINKCLNEIIYLKYLIWKCVIVMLFLKKIRPSMRFSKIFWVVEKMKMNDDTKHIFGIIKRDAYVYNFRKSMPIVATKDDKWNGGVWCWATNQIRDSSCFVKNCTWPSAKLLLNKTKFIKLDSKLLCTCGFDGSETISARSTRRTFACCPAQ